MNPTLKNQIEKTLALAVSDFKDAKEALEFLKDFLTKNEMETLSKRLAVSYWLSKKRNYSNIQNNLKVSSSTVAEGNTLLKKNSIKNVIKKIDADVWATKWSSRLGELLKK